MVSRIISFAAIILFLFGFQSGLLLVQGQEIVFPGKFFIVDRSALYDESNNELSNGSFESETDGILDNWELTIVNGGPIATVESREDSSGRALRIITSSEDDSLLIKNEPVTIAKDSNRYYLSFKMRSDFGVIDANWAVGLRIVSQWIFADGTNVIEEGLRVTHSLRSWRPILTEMSVPDGAVMLQIGFQVVGVIPNSIANHTTWLDEVRLFKEPLSLQPVQVVGTATEDGLGGLGFTGSTFGDDDGYRIEASFIPGTEGKKDDGEIKGEIVNLTGRDAPVDLIFAVDLDAEGGRIDYDISRGEQITSESKILEDPLSADFYSVLTMSTVPLNSVTTTTGNTVGLSVSLDMLRIFLFRYNTDLKHFEILYRFGLESSGSHDRASFNHHILRTESKWTYRDLWQRFTDKIETDKFSVIRPSKRPIGAQFVSVFDINDAELKPHISDLSGLIEDLGIVSMQNPVVPPLPDKLFERLEEFDIELLNYDYPWILEESTTESTEEPPSYDDIEDTVKDVANQDDTTTFRRLKRTLAQQVLRDKRGDLLANRVFSPDFAFGNWLIRIPVQTRPTLSPYLDLIMNEKYIPAFIEGDASPLTTRPRINSLVFDGFMKESKVLDCINTEASVAPLTYDPNDGTVCAHLSDGNIEYLNSMRKQLDAEGFDNKFLVGNLNQLGPAIFGMPILDSGVWEATPFSGPNFGHQELNARRMMFSKKKLGVIDKSNWCDLPDSHIQNFIDTIALLGFYPNLLNFVNLPECLFDNERQTAVRTIVKEVVPVLDAMNNEGWQSITYAKIENAEENDELSNDLRVERFGIAPPIYFSILNNHDGLLNNDNSFDQNVVLSIDTVALGFTETPIISVSYGEIDTPEVVTNEGELELAIGLGAGKGAIIRIDRAIVIPTITPTLEPTPTPSIQNTLAILTVDPETSGKSRKPQSATVEAFDQDMQLLPGIIVEASTKGKGAFVKPASVITDANGMARFKFRFGFVSKKGEIIFTADSFTATIKQK